MQAGVPFFVISKQKKKERCLIIPILMAGRKVSQNSFSRLHILRPFTDIRCCYGNSLYAFLATINTLLIDYDYDYDCVN
jgi:hypothetical protein